MPRLSAQNCVVNYQFVINSMVINLSEYYIQNQLAIKFL